MHGLNQSPQWVCKNVIPCILFTVEMYKFSLWKSFCCCHCWMVVTAVAAILIVSFAACLQMSLIWIFHFKLYNLAVCDNIIIYYLQFSGEENSEQSSIRMDWTKRKWRFNFLCIWKPLMNLTAWRKLNWYNLNDCSRKG